MTNEHGSPRKLHFCLLVLRVSVTLVMFMWTLDKLVNPAHANAVFSRFYGLPLLDGDILLVLALGELALVICFALGVLKTWSYGAVLLFHSISTLSSFRQYLDPWDSPNLLFFAAWPMLAACVTLFLLREQDCLLAFRTRPKAG